MGAGASNGASGRHSRPSSGRAIAVRIGQRSSQSVNSSNLVNKSHINNNINKGRAEQSGDSASASSRPQSMLLNGETARLTEEMLRDLDARTNGGDKKRKGAQLEVWIERAHVPGLYIGTNDDEVEVTPRQLHLESMEQLEQLDDINRF